MLEERVSGVFMCLMGKGSSLGLMEVGKSKSGLPRKLLLKNGKMALGFEV